MLALLGGALLVGAQGPDAPPTDTQRVDRITSQVRCPTCRGQSVADSDAPAAVSIRDEVRRRVAEGETDRAILSFLVDRFTADIRLSPEAKGVGILVWALPVLGVLTVVVALSVVFARRRRQGRARHASAADRDLVSEALRG